MRKENKRRKKGKKREGVEGQKHEKAKTGGQRAHSQVLK
jgi:hypothetical protein